MDFDLKNKQKRKDAYIQKTQAVMKTKSFFDKHFITTKISKAFTYLLSGISILLGLTAVFSVFKSFFGLSGGLFDMFSERPALGYFLAMASLCFLFCIEWAKHHFHTQALTEQYRDTDDHGKMETRIALFASILSTLLSVWGGVIVANELAGTQKAKTLSAIEAEYLPQIKAAKTAKETYFNANSWKGKLSNNRVPEYSRLGSVVTDLENAFAAKKESEGLTAFVASDTKATFNLSAILGGSQLVVELLLYGCLWWMVYFDARVFDEAFQNQSPTPSTYYRPQNTNPQFATNQSNPLNTPNRVVVTPFKNRKVTPSQPKSQTQSQTPVTVVTQQPQGVKSQPQSQIKVVDVAAEKKRIYGYIPRLLKNYTDNLFYTVLNDVKVLAKAGYKVSIKPNKRAKIDKTGVTNLQVNVLWDEDSKSLTINYPQS